MSDVSELIFFLRQDRSETTKLELEKIKKSMKKTLFEKQKKCTVADLMTNSTGIPERQRRGAVDDFNDDFNTIGSNSSFLSFNDACRFPGSSDHVRSGEKRYLSGPSPQWATEYSSFYPNRTNRNQDSGPVQLFSGIGQQIGAEDLGCIST